MASERFENAKAAIERAQDQHDLNNVRDAWMEGPNWDRMLPREADALLDLWKQKARYFTGYGAG